MANKLHSNWWWFWVKAIEKLLDKQKLVVKSGVLQIELLATYALVMFTTPATKTSTAVQDAVSIQVT